MAWDRNAGWQGITARTGWAEAQTFTLVEGQTDYVFDGITDADTDPVQSLVHWGVSTLLPTLDYTILADRIRLTNAPSAVNVAAGEPLVVRIKRA